MSAKQWPLIINLGNSIIGVSVLAMPFCFSQCGIILGILLLLGAAGLTSISCTLLMKSALVTKRRSFEFLALHSYGGLGKLAVELSSIGLLIGTCIAFYVVIGDLGPAIISKVLNVANTSTLRTGLLVLVAAVVVIPLGLLRDVESLNNISTASICFYIVLVSTVVLRAMPNIISGVWINKVVFWNPAGVFKCLPIFAMAFGCQTQLFLMYNALSEPSLNQIVLIVRGAVSLCTGVYLSMGFFGYVAYCDSNIAGDILMNFIPSAYADILKLGFVLSIAVSFPLVIFPCRASIQTLLFAPRTLHDNTIGGGLMRVREMHFRTITMMIIISTLCVGIAVPQIEFILGLTGSTMGSVICFVFPALIFLKVSPISTDHSRFFAKVVLIMGITIFFVSTYTTIHNGQGEAEPIVKKSDQHIMAPLKPDLPDVKVKKVTDNPNVENADKRQEPVIPQAPEDEKSKEVKIEPKIAESLEKKPSEIGKKGSEQGNVAKALNQTVEKTKKEMSENLNKQKVILAELQEQQKEQKEILKEQKKLLAELKEHDQMHKNDTAKNAQPGNSKSVNQGGVQPLQQQGGQPVQEQGGQPVPQQGVQPLQQQGGQPLQQQGGQLVQQQGGQPVPQQGGQPVPQQGGQPVQQLGGQPVQQRAAAKPVPQQGGQPVQQLGGQPVQQLGGPAVQQRAAAQPVQQGVPAIQKQAAAQPVQQGGPAVQVQQRAAAKPVQQQLQQQAAQPVPQQSVEQQQAVKPVVAQPHQLGGQNIPPKETKSSAQHPNVGIPAPNHVLKKRSIPDPVVGDSAHQVIQNVDQVESKDTKGDPKILSANKIANSYDYAQGKANVKVDTGRDLKNAEQEILVGKNKK